MLNLTVVMSLMEVMISKCETLYRRRGGGQEEDEEDSGRNTMRARGRSIEAYKHREKGKHGEEIKLNIITNTLLFK